MDRAQVFGEAAAAMTLDDVGHIYTDGYVVMVKMTADRMLDVLAFMKKRGVTVEAGRSADGMYSAFVLPDKTAAHAAIGGDNSEAFCMAVGLTQNYHDHRDEDYYEIDLAAALNRRYLKLD